LKYDPLVPFWNDSLKIMIGAMVSIVLFAGTVAAGASTPPKASTVILELAKRLPIKLTITYNASNDPNHLLGRPNEYTSKASFSFAGIPSSETEGDSVGDVDFGGSVEVFPTSNGALSREKYIESIFKAAPILGTEYDFLNGPVLLRVSRYLTPSQAKAVDLVFKKLST
jgi:hypothetical protein